MIDDVQYFDGTVERKLFLGRKDFSPDVRLSLADARAIAANLLAAADEIKSAVTS